MNSSELRSPEATTDIHREPSKAELELSTLASGLIREIADEIPVCSQTDPELFFPSQGESYYHASRICGACAVRAQCLALSLTGGREKGMWGGKTSHERAALSRGRGPEQLLELIKETLADGSSNSRQEI